MIDMSRALWRKSSRSSANSGDGQCVELASLPPALWRTSTRTGGANGSGGNCVELAGLPADLIGIRDSKQTSGPVLLIDHAEALALYNLVQHTR